IKIREYHIRLLGLLIHIILNESFFKLVLGY
ncbi:hypothetical protein LCGC14_2211820, partial [marine sediment metagenome]